MVPHAFYRKHDSYSKPPGRGRTADLSRPAFQEIKRPPCLKGGEYRTTCNEPVGADAHIGPLYRTPCNAKRRGVGAPPLQRIEKNVCDCFGIYINKKNERKKR